ncbi:MAG: ASCH domain-containing protein [Treponema sp.]|jgi:hypothetical protein|nr:ASCH domain-containing protein [Treponema sp.]
MDILIIKEEFGKQILTGKKTWELRGGNTKKRGRIAIAFSGTKKKYGTVELIDSIPLTKELYESNVKKHRSYGTWNELKNIYKNPYAWVMKKPEVFEEPIDYNHPYGAIIWVKEKGAFYQ